MSSFFFKLKKLTLESMNVPTSPTNCCHSTFLEIQYEYSTVFGSNYD